MIRHMPSYAGSPWLLRHRIKPSDTDVGGRDTGGLWGKTHTRWLTERVTQPRSKPDLTLVGSAAWLPHRGKCAGRAPGELRGVTPTSGRAEAGCWWGGKSISLFKASILSNSVSSVRCSASREGCGDVAGMFSHYLSHEVTPRPLVAVH